MNAQILQQDIMNDFFCNLASCFSANPLGVYTDKELADLKWIAEEEQDGKKIKAIREEMNRRNREI